MGTATAAPTTPGGAGPSVDVNLSEDQRAALQQAVQQSRTLGNLPSSGQYGFFVELDADSSGAVFQATESQGQTAAGAAARAAKSRIAGLQDSLLTRLPTLRGNTQVLYRTSAISAGVAVLTDVTNYRALLSLPGVRTVYPIAPKTIENAGVADLVNAPEVWESLDNTGQGVDVGIIDTGIDYTHTDFGGSGSVGQYNLLRRLEDRPAPARVFPNAKVVGGFDFAGDDYNASDPTSVPQPDPNPLDCNGHGSHVAGTAAGYGVNEDGSTYSGPYDTSLDLKSLRIGPGIAPEANLWALRVFGCEGSTNVIGAAMEFAADPNGDGSIEDRLDVVNQSLGTDYGIVDDADGVLAGELMELGIMMVFSGGNAGDTYDIGGSPGNNPRVLSVAATDDGFAVFDGWQIVNQPELFEPDVRPGLRSLAFEGEGDHTGDLVLPVAGDDPTACAPLSGDYSGQFLVIEADGFACGSVTKSANAKAAGADGFVIIADDDSLETGITGDPEIPGILIRASDGEVVKDALVAGEQLTITFGDTLAGAAQVSDPAAVDTLATFSSRGVRQSVKPDVAAPGVNTVSASVGTGDQTLTISGTSMAAPATSGLAALIRHENPSWTPEQVKADIMNTAGNDVYAERNQTGLIYAPNRVGSGRIDAPAALSNEVLAYVQDEFSVVSASFGVVEVSNPFATLTKTIVVDNQGDTAQTYDLSYDSITDQPGVRYSLNRGSVTVAANSTASFDIRMTATRALLRKTIDPTVSRTQLDLPRQYVADDSGRILLTPTSGNHPQLRVPVHSNVKPVSTLTQSLAPSGGNTGVITLDGQGVRNGQPGGLTSYNSTVSAFSLLGTSPVMPTCGVGVITDCVVTEGERSVDLANVGVASDAAFFGARDRYLYFAVAAHGNFTTPAAFTDYSVFIDSSGDGVWDYQLLTTRFADGADPVDVPVVIGADRDGNLLPSNEEPAITFLNGAPGSFDTNSFDNNQVIMPFPAAAMPKLLLNPRFSFGVQSSSGFGTVDNLGTTVTADGFPELAADTMSYNVRNPSLSFSDGTDPSLPAILALSGDGTTIGVTVDVASYVADRAVGGPKGIMLVHTHNPNGQRVALITLPPGTDGRVIA